MLFKGDYDGSSYPAGSICRFPDGGYRVRTYRETWEPVAAPADPSCQGSPGRDGRDGRHGIDGKNGRDGERGAKGEPGEAGKRGKRGEAGERGRDGNSYSHTRVIHQNDPTGVPVPAIFDSLMFRGQVVYISGDGHVDLALAQGSANAPSAMAVGFALDTTNAGQAGNYITNGVIENESWNLTPGIPYYLSPTVPGGITPDYPTTFGDYVIIVGFAATEKSLVINISHKVWLQT